MGNLNGIPINWGFGSLFPEGLQDIQVNLVTNNQVLEEYESPLQNSIFYTPKIYNDDITGPPDKENYYVRYIGFNSKTELEQSYLGAAKVSFGQMTALTANEFLKESPDRIVCFYLKSVSTESDKLLLLRMGDKVFDSYLNAGDYNSTAVQVSRRIFELGQDKEGFNYSFDNVEEAFRNAVPVKRTIPNKWQKTDASELYHDNYARFVSLAGGNSIDKQTENAIRLLCDTLSKIKYDVVQSYNRQNDVTYNTVTRQNDNLTAADILSMNRRLLKMASRIKQFQNAEFKTADDLMDFINQELLDISAPGTVTEHVIVYPFVNLLQQKREELLLLLLNGDDLTFPGTFSSFRHQLGKSHITKGLIVYHLLATAKDNERLRIIVSLNNSGKIFDLMNASRGDDFLFATVYLIGATIKAFIPEASQPELFAEAVANGNFIFYNDEHSGAYKGTILSKDTKLLLENDTRIDLNRKSLFEDLTEAISNSMTGIIEPGPALPEKSIEQIIYEKLYVSPKRGFDPLELIAFRTEAEIKSKVLPMPEDDIVLVPACMVYLLFREREITEENFRFISTLTFLLLPLGIAGLVAAIEAANVLGIIITTTDIIVDGTVLAANIPEVQKDDPEFTKAVNTFAFFYGLMRLGSSLPGLIEKAGKVSKSIEEALKITKQRTAKFFEELKGLFKNSSRSEALFRDIFKLVNKGEISAFQFNKIAKRLEENTGIKMHLVDVTNKQFKQLYSKWKENPVYATFHSHTFKNKKYNIELEGPSIYFFRDVDIKLTSYTLQHELFHVKLWHDLVKEFGKKGGVALYNKIPGWLHEADVLGQLLKQNKLKPGKWQLDDIINDLGVLNRNISRNADWGISFKKMTGRESLALEDLKNWDLTKWLNKF